MKKFKEGDSMRKIWSMLLIAALWGTGTPLLAQKDSTVVERLPALIREALENNPGLQAGYHAWQSDLARVPQAGALPDPMISFSLANMPVNSFAFDQEPMTGKKVTLSQKIPFPGKLGLKSDIARAGAEMAGARYQELRNNLIASVKKAYFDLFAIDRSVEIVRKNKELMHEFVQIAQTKYSVGRGVQQDVLRAQVELSKLTDKLITLEQKREAAKARLNALLNRPVGSAIGEITDVTKPDTEFKLDDLKTLAAQHRPLLKAWQAVVLQNEKKLGLAKKSFLPDFNLGIAYTQRDVLRSGMGGVDFFSGTIGLNIPLYFWRKQSKNVEERELGLMSARQKFENIRNLIYADLDKTLSNVRKNAQLVELFRTGIIPQASQALQSAIAGYQTNKVDFLTLLSNQMILFNYEMEYYRVLSDLNKAIADLEFITGTELGQP